MKRVLVMAVLVLSFPALQAVAIDWDALGPDLQPHSTNLPDQVTLYEVDGDDAEVVPSDLPTAEAMMMPAFTSRVMGGHCCQRPRCCDLWADYCGSVRQWCPGMCGHKRCHRCCSEPAYCEAESACCEAEPACCDAVSACDEAEPACCETCCERRCGLHSLFSRLGDCCGSLDFGCGCDAGCDLAVDCCDPCDDCGRRWFNWRLFSGLRHSCCDYCYVEGDTWHEGETVYEYDAEEQTPPMPPGDDHSASRLRMPSWSLSRWIRG